MYETPEINLGVAGTDGAAGAEGAGGDGGSFDGGAGATFSVCLLYTSPSPRD